MQIPMKGDLFLTQLTRLLVFQSLKTGIYPVRKTKKTIEWKRNKGIRYEND